MKSIVNHSKLNNRPDEAGRQPAETAARRSAIAKGAKNERYKRL